MKEEREVFLAAIDQAELETVTPNCGKVGWIYFIRCEGTGLIKIGFTKGNIGKRLAALQTGSASQLSPMVCHPGTMENERRLHERFAADRVSGEWFKPALQVRAYMIASLWTMCEISLRRGVKLQYWEAIGLETSATMLGSLPEGILEILGAE